MTGVGPGRVRIVASDAAVTEAAQLAATDGASALGTALCAYLFAAGTHPGVLLSPVVVLNCCLGARRALDGRARQPGLGLKRPRGFVSGSEIPSAARVAAPSALTVAHVAFAYDSRSERVRALRGAQTAAKRAGAPERAHLFELCLGQGAGTLAAEECYKTLVSRAGPVSQGLLSRQDLQAIDDVDQEAAQRVGDKPEQVTWGFPWEPDVAEQQVEGVERHAIITADRRGSVAVISYLNATSGVYFDELELRAPSLAVPVRRGVERVAAGRRLAYDSGACIDYERTEFQSARALVDAGAVRLSHS